MVARSGSYLDDFYHTFWTDYLHDRLANPDSYGFYLRHQADFVIDYAPPTRRRTLRRLHLLCPVGRPEGMPSGRRSWNFFYRYPGAGGVPHPGPARLGL